MERQPIEKLRYIAKPVIDSKLEEFRILGYEDVKEEQLWNFLESRVWKQKNDLPIHQLVSDIFAVKINDFMNHTTVESYKVRNWFESAEGEDILKNLL